MANRFVEVSFNLAKCRREVRDLAKLLKANEELSETNDVLPFFKARKQLCAFLGTFVPDIGPARQIAREFSFVGDFSADLFVGNRESKHYLAIEFEEGRKDSVLNKRAHRATKEWSRRFEHGYSQLIDWFWTLDDYKKTDKFRSEYGAGHVVFWGLLVAGRDSGLTEDDRIRLSWRADKVLVDSHSISCITFDGLHRSLENRLDLYAAAASRQSRKP